MDSSRSTLDCFRGDVLLKSDYFERITPRKGRLLAIGLCKLVWSHLDDKCCRAVEAIQKWIDGLATSRDIQNAAAESLESAIYWSEAASLDRLHLPKSLSSTSVYCLTESVETEQVWMKCRQSIPEQVAFNVRIALQELGVLTDAEIDSRIVDRIVDVFGEPKELDDPKLHTIPASAQSLARQIYYSESFAQVGELASLLAQCNTLRPLSDHLLTPTCHIRGCWAIEAAAGFADLSEPPN